MLTINEQSRSAPAAVDCVEVVRPLYGRYLPNNHGYLLYAALCTIGWVGHGEEGVQVLPVIGRRGRGTETVVDARSELVIRASLRTAGVLARLPSTQVLDVGGAAVRLGPATLRQLRPSPRLLARMVTIQRSAAGGKRFNLGSRGDIGEFRCGLDRQIVNAGLLPSGVDVLDRGSLRIRDSIVTGFGVRLLGMSDAESLLVQSVGLGGRRRFGCGVFVPC